MRAAVAARRVHGACPAAARRPAVPPRQPRRCYGRVIRAADDSDRERAQAQVLEQVEASAQLVEQLMGDVSRDIFVGAAASYVTDSAESDGSPAAAVREAVGGRLDQMDSTFLATLDAYIQGATDKGAHDVAEVLLMVRDEVLRRLSARLPAEMQLLDAALGAVDSKARMALLRTYARLSVDELPPAVQQESGVPDSSGVASSSGARRGTLMHCLASDLERAATQLISDMELMPAVPDRRLLAKLVLLREELQQLLVEGAFQQSMRGSGSASGATAGDTMPLPSLQLGAVPKSCLVFLQRLMALASPDERRALLQHALQQDTERYQELPTSSAGLPPPTNFERLRAEAEAPQDWVRPGRFMQAVNALQQEMLHPSTSNSGAPSDALLERLESIRREALSVLLDMAGEGQAFLP